MVTIKTFKDIRKIKDIWNKLVERNDNFLPYSYYFYNYCIYKFYRLYQFKTLSRPLFLVLYHDKEPVLIAPLVKKLFKSEYGLFGDIQGSDSIDFIYDKDMDLKLFLQCLEAIKKYTGSIIKYSRIQETSLLLSAVQFYYPQICLSKYPHVNIKFGDSVDDYFQGLSKNSRQNIRTAYNRIAKDHLSYNLTIASTEEEISDALDLYYERQSDKYKRGMKLKGIREYISRHFKHDTVSLTKSRNRLILYLSIGDKIAACFLGLVNNSKTTVTIPRLAINSQFAKYSPGNILIMESIQYLIKETTIRNMDLSRGDERYKYVMGGREYNTYSFNI